MAYDIETGELRYDKVTDVIVHTDPVVEHLTIDDETLTTTAEHPFYTQERGWVAAGELKSGEHVRKADGSYGVVKSIIEVKHPQKMYNLTVEKEHTFFVGEGRWLVHNEDPIECTIISAYFNRIRWNPETSAWEPYPAIDTSTFDPNINFAERTGNGGIRDSRQFWPAWAREYPESLSERNMQAATGAWPNGVVAPIVDEVWVETFPEHAPYIGSQLIHHHVAQGRFAIPVPVLTHMSARNAIDPSIGMRGTTIWHWFYFNHIPLPPAP